MVCRGLFSSYVGSNASYTAGTIETAINKEDLADEEKRSDMTKRIPLGRLGEPEDIAEPVCFMASDMARYSESTGRPQCESDLCL